MIVHGLNEHNSANREERDQNDKSIVQEIITMCQVEEGSVVKVMRMGKFDKNKAKRPLVATLGSVEQKIQIFRKAAILRTPGSKYSEVRVGRTGVYDF